MGLILQSPVIGTVAIALFVSAIISYLSTPLVRKLAFKIKAVDVPSDGRRMHKAPIPRLGGLAIFFGFLCSSLLFSPMTPQFGGMLIGASIIVVLGIFDDIYALPAKPKFLIQIVAALVASLFGNVITILSNPNIFSTEPYWNLGVLSIPFTVLWIVAITNAVNLIDGLDGLACGVSTISSMTMLVISLSVSEGPVAILMGALVGACLGFLPYNLNPAKIFMGDTGSTFLGFILAVASIQGLFKLSAIVSFAVPFLILGLPIFDTCFAILRRLADGRSPMSPDREHIHHRLIDMGFSQKQAVATLYIISAILGLSAVILTTSGIERAIIFFGAFCIAIAITSKVVMSHSEAEESHSNLENLENSEDHKHNDDSTEVSAPLQVEKPESSSMNPPTPPKNEP